MNFLNFSYADAPYCYTGSHTCICHTHTASVHPCHQLWFVALCCIVTTFATLSRSTFNRKKNDKKSLLVNSLVFVSCSVVVFLMLTGRMLHSLYPLLLLLLLLKCSHKALSMINAPTLSSF